MYTVRLAVQRLDKLGVDHTYQIIEGLVRIRDAAEQRNFALAQFLQMQFVRHRQLGDGWQVKRGKAHTYTYQIDFAVLPAACLKMRYCLQAMLSGSRISKRSNRMSSGDW